MSSPAIGSFQIGVSGVGGLTGGGFFSAVDIANRALQHCGATRIDPAQGFLEDSKNASETQACYDGLRRAELRRNVWRFATRRTAIRPITATTMFIQPSLWSSTVTYVPGSLVTDTAGVLWSSIQNDNLNNQPGFTPAWEKYFGAVTADVYDSTQSYFAGELVYEFPGDGTYTVFKSVVNGNATDPSVPTAWDATVTYNKDQVIQRSSTLYQSLINLNLNKDPASVPALWVSITTYSTGQQVTGSDGMIYQSLVNSNLGIDPTLDNGTHWHNTGVLAAWTTNFSGQSGNDQWVEIDVGLVAPNIQYPVGTGPMEQSDTRNVYPLPANFLREAPQDPKAGSASIFGAPTRLLYTDWEYEGGFLVTRMSQPIVYRFVADIVDVTQMDDLFCEGLAARIGFEVCETLTQSTVKQNTIASAYNRFMTEARTVNGIETGPTEAPEDDWVATRL